jgi:hypothetical protein
VAALILTVGCGPGFEWATAAQWDQVPGETSWEWILDTDALPKTPPTVDYLGLEGLDAEAAYVERANDAGATTWCYLSIGSAEDWRDDFDDFVALDAAERDAGRDGILGRDYDGWEGEIWLNLGAYEAFMPLMEARLDTCAARGFAWVEYDNMDIRGTNTGFDTSAAEVREYMHALLDATEDRGMGAIHKNATHLSDLEPRFEAMLLEDCVLWDFCEEAQPYLDAGKLVFNAEYPQSWRDEGRDFDIERACRASGDVSTLIKRLDLDEKTVVCAAILAEG